MKKLLRPKDLLLLGMAGVLDIFEEVRDPLEMGAASCREVYGWAPRRFKRHNFTRVVQRGLRTGEIERVVKNGEACLRLTSAGEERVARDFPLFALQNRKWDGRWRVVVFDIAEINKRGRDVLREKLKELGFGMLQESVWITPHDISKDMREFLEEQHLGAMVFVLEVSGILAGDKDILVDKIWHLSALYDAYEEIIFDCEDLQKMYVVASDRVSQHTGVQGEKGSEEGRGEIVRGEIVRGGIVNGTVNKETVSKERESRTKGMENKIREIRQKYLGAVMRDPFLPKGLLPENWPAAKARKAVAGLAARE